MFLRATALALVALIAVPAVASAAPPPPSRAAAEQALTRVQELQKGRGVRTGRELTPALAQLFASLPSLSADDRRTAEAILARPDDSQPDPPGTHKWSGHEAGGSPRCTTHFCVHFTTSGADASNAGYAQAMANLFEDDVYPCENGTAAAACAGSPGLGWRDPAPDGSAGETGVARCTQPSCVDIYIEDLFPDRIFGYVALDPGQTQDPSVPHFGYLVMDRDYDRFATPALTGTEAEEVTAAHEYNHVLQNVYDYLEDTWMFEATAVYMEDKVYPSINDYLNYVNAWVANTRQPLTAFPATNLKAYGSAVWNHWLDHRYGPGVVRGAWEQSVGQADFAPGAYSAAIGGAGGGGFADEFERFAAAVAEWEASGAGFPDRYPDVPRDGLLPADSETQPFPLPHTTFAFLDVPIPASAPTIRLTGRLPAGTQGAVALVGRTGTDPTAGTVTTNLTPMPSGGTAVVSLDNPGQFGRITAVVVNADPSRAGFDPQADDWIFTKDASDVVVSLAQPGPPIATTGAPGVIADHAASVNGTVDPHLIDTTWTVEYGPTIGYGSTTARQPLAGSTVGSAPVVAQLGGLKAKTTYHYRLVATNSAGVARGADMTFTTARDVTKPVVSFIVKRQRIRAVRTRGLRYLGRCSERCLGTARLTVSRSVARRLGTSTTLGKARIVLDPRTTSSKLRVRLTSRSKKRLAGVRKGFRATLKIRVADESKNLVAVTRRVKLTR
jgi:hypothetical protein